MPKYTLESMRGHLVKVNSASLISEIERQLESSLSGSYSSVYSQVYQLNKNEQDIIYRRKRAALNVVQQEHSDAKYSFEQKCNTQTAQLEQELIRDYGVVPPRDWWSTVETDPYNYQRTQRRQQLKSKQQTERDQLEKLHLDAYKLVEAEEERKARDALDLLDTKYQQIVTKLQQEYGRIMALVLNDDFHKKHVMPGLESIASSVRYFFEKHPWATQDIELVEDCFRYNGLNAPWLDWYSDLTAKMSSVGANTLGTCSFSTLNDYHTWSLAETPLSEAFNRFDRSCVLGIQKPELNSGVMTPYMQNFLYTSTKLSALYANAQRSGIKSLSYTENEYDRANVDLVFRRVDWLRLVTTTIPWSSRYSARASQQSISPVLPLSIEEVDDYARNSNIQVILLNVGTEHDPLWILMQRGQQGGWNAFVPDAKAPFSILRDKMKQALSDRLPASMRPVQVYDVLLDKHDLEKNADETLPTELIWHTVLGSRVLPFCLGCHVPTGATLDTYRHAVPVATLLEATLGSAAHINPIYYPSSFYVPRTEVGKRYALRSFWKTPGTLTDAWTLPHAGINDARACLSFDDYWPTFDNMQRFLAAVDVGALAVRHVDAAAPVLSISPPKAIPGLKPSDSPRESLTRYDFFYLMTVAYQQDVNCLILDKSGTADLWKKQWKDCDNEFALTYAGVMVTKTYYSSVGVRNLLDCNVHLTTVTPLSTTLPAVLSYTASCAARNRLMREHFSRSAINSNNALDDLWRETEQHVLSLLTRVATMRDATQFEGFLDKITTFTGANGGAGWFQRGCVDQPTPSDEQERLVWEFAQIAQMGVRGLEVIFKQWNSLDEPLSSLTFDLNCQTTLPSQYIDRMRSYADVYSKNALPRLNLIMPERLTDVALAESFSALLTDLDERTQSVANKENKDVYLYNLQTQPVAERIAFLRALLAAAQTKSIKTLIVIPAYDRAVSCSNTQECLAQDLYRQIQNCILNNQRLLSTARVKKNTEHLQAYVQQRALPRVTAVRDVREDTVMLPSEENAEYVLGGGVNGIQQQLQQAQQQQKQVAQQQQVEVEVEEEVQILNYRSRGQILWTKDTIDDEGREYWEQLPDAVKLLSGFNSDSKNPLSDLFDVWVGSKRSARHVIKYMEPEAAEKIMKYASLFRFGLFYDNLPPGFFLAKKDEDLVLCFDRSKESDELRQLAWNIEHGTMTARQSRKIILHDPKKADLMRGGDDRQFEMMPNQNRAEQVKPSYWRHLVTQAAARPDYLEAVRSVLGESADADAPLLEARIQASLQLSAFQSRQQPLAKSQQETVALLQSWVASFIKNPTFVTTLFLKDRNGLPLDAQRIKDHLLAFGQIAHAYDALPVKEEHYGSYLFMQLANQMAQTFRDNPAYFAIWRDRVLTPSANWTECLSKAEIDAAVQSLRILNGKPAHAELWWTLVDAHGATTGAMQYSPLWTSTYQFFQYIDEQDLQLSPLVIEQWKQLVQSSPINGQVLLERIQSVLKRVANSAIDREDSQKYQQNILNHLNDIDWKHDGLFYANRYEGLSGFWDKDFVAREFQYASSQQASYIPAFDSFKHVEEKSEQLAQESAAIDRYLGRYYANDGMQYWKHKQFFNQYWNNNPAVKELNEQARIALIRFLLMSFVLGQDRTNEMTEESLTQLIKLCADTHARQALLKLSDLQPIDKAGVREVLWPLHFTHLPQLIKALSSPKCEALLGMLTPASPAGTALVKHAEIALNCFQSAHFQSMAAEAGLSLDTLLEAWLEEQQSNPYLKTFPWLILEVKKAGPAFSVLHGNLNDLEQKGAAEYDRLKKQMHSINFSRSTYLPSMPELVENLPLSSTWMFSFSKQLSADTRKDFIKDASAKGCHIVDQGVGFRVFTEEEKLGIEAEFQRRMSKTAYFSMNQALFQRFIQNVAIPEMTQAQTQQLFGQVIDTFFFAQNKTYYNELGQILGQILDGISESGEHAQHYYSLPQLHDWLKSLANTTANRQEQHYPVHLLRELLHAPGEQHLMSPGLLKPLDRLNECQERSPDSYLKRNWLRLSELSLPNQYSALIARLMLRSPELSQLSVNVQAVFEQKDQSPQLLEATYQFLQQPTVLDGRLPHLNLKNWFNYTSTTAVTGINPEMHQQARLQLLSYLKEQVTPKRDLSGKILTDWSIPLVEIDRLWEQIRFEERSSWFGGPTFTNQHSAQRKLIILSYATQGAFNLPVGVESLWNKMDDGALQSLVDYYQSGAQLSLPALMSLLEKKYTQQELLERIHSDDDESLSSLINLLDDKKQYTKQELLKHLEQHHVPLSPGSLINLLDADKCCTQYELQERLHYYETVVQGQHPDGRAKRIYSASDKKELLRVISGFEKKGVGRCADEEQEQLINLFYYMNEYSQLTPLSTMSFQELQATLQAAKNDLVSQSERSSVEAQQASARLLACMRELLLRRSGKWANHTQMLALLYAACHNDEGLIHQVRTGQGKSILTLMRSAYLALTGDVVDVFSAKESLSLRDYQDAKPILDAMEIPCSYITPDSPVDHYKQRIDSADVTQVKGAVNFATLGNFSLFLSRNAWMDAVKIKLNPKHRVAFLDEADHILLDDQTQFNFPDPGDEREAYNFDEWASRAIYQYYRDIVATNPDFIKTQIISRHEHLDRLSQLLIDLKATAPEDSKFFGKFLLPAMTAKGDARKEAIAKRDEALVYLLKAAHSAHRLKEGVDFCSSYDQRTLLGQVVPVRILQVMINNQVQEGATYSDAVQQMLCIRKNEEAAQQGEVPNYFVDPESKIVLSQNNRSVLLTHYRKIEGCTGTAGDTKELEQYRDVYGLDHVVKLPTHEVVRTEFKPSSYAANFEEQINAIVDTIAANAPLQPLLVTCKDDIEVKRLYKAVHARLKVLNLDFKLIRDTNDSGKTEAEIVPEAGAIGTVVFSARMGRGTDIKPQSDKGLFVLRTYLASARVTKQEIGRQGRNGWCGTCQTIIDVSELNLEYQTYECLSGGKELLERLLAYETAHLDAKVAKHHKKGSTKFDWLCDEDNAAVRENYLKARVCIQFRHYLQQKQQVKLRRQEALMAWMSLGVEHCLRSTYAVKPESRQWRHDMHAEWKEIRSTIEAAWQKYLTEQKDAAPEVQQQQWKQFIATVGGSWKRLMALARSSEDMDLMRWSETFSEAALLKVHQRPLADAAVQHLEERPLKKLETVPHLEQFINFHQKWMEQAVACRNRCLSKAPESSVAALKIEFDEYKLRGLNQLFIQLRSMRADYLLEAEDQVSEQTHVLFDQLITQLYKTLDSQLLFMMPSLRAGTLLFKWMDKAKVLFAQLPAKASESVILQQMMALQVLANVLGAGSASNQEGVPSWLGSERFAAFDLQDPTRYANVLDFLTDMTFSVGLASWQDAESATPAIQQFLEHTGQALVEDHWDALDQTILLQQFSDFLVLPAQQEGAESVIEAMAQAFPTLAGVKTVLNLMVKSALPSKQGQAFKEYLCRNATLLCQIEYAGVLPIIADLTLGETASKQNILPDVDAFMCLTIEDKSTPFCKTFAELPLEEKAQFNQNFWLFLSKRRPLNSDEINSFYKLLQTHCTWEDALKLVQLPPYTSLAHIQSKVLFASEKQQVVDGLEEFSAAAHHFNQWMTAQHHFVSAAAYTPPITASLADSQRWINLYEALPAAKSRVLFAMMHDLNIPASLSDTLFQQLEMLITEAALPLDEAVWMEYGAELMALLTLAPTWATALESCLEHLPDNEGHELRRLAFLQQLSHVLHADERLGGGYEGFPAQCYQAWKQGRFDQGEKTLSSLIDLYHSAQSDSPRIVLSTLMQKAMNADMDTTQWSSTFSTAAHYATLFCELPEYWRNALHDSINAASVFEQEVLQENSLLFRLILESMPSEVILNIDTLAPALFTHWMRECTVSSKQTETKEAKEMQEDGDELSTQSLKIQGVQQVLLSAAHADQWGLRRSIIAEYLAESEKPLAERLTMLSTREQLMLAFDKIPAEWQSVVLDETQTILLGDSLELMQKRQQFLRLLSEELPQQLSHNAELSELMINSLWNNKASSSLPDDEAAVVAAIKQSVSVLAVQSEAKDTAKEQFFIKQAKLILAKEQDSAALLQLSAFAAQLPNDYPEESYQALWKGVCSGLLLTDDYESARSLHKAIQITQQALQDSQEKKLDTWFVTQETRDRRVDLMRGLHHGYVSLGKAENDSCWTRFANMIRYGLSYFPKLFGERYHHRAMDGLTRLSTMLHEMIDIAQMPGMQLDTPKAKSEGAGASAITDLLTHYGAEFKELKASYDAAWWKNLDRRSQSAKLFDGVMNVDKGITRDEYYLSVLKQILSSQKDIIESDQNACIVRNKKGYSRLYDLSVKMLVSVASGYLTDTNNDMSPRNERANTLKELLDGSLLKHTAIRDQRYGLFQGSVGTRHPALQYLDDAIDGLEGRGPSFGLRSDDLASE